MIPRRFIRIASVILAGVFFPGGGGAVPASAQKNTPAATVYEKEIRKKSGALDSIKSEIDNRRRKIRELEKAEGSYQARLAFLESNIEDSKQYLAMLQGRIDTAETTIVFLTDSLHGAQLMLADRQSVMKERLRRAYMTGISSPLMVLLMSQNPVDLVHRAKYIEEVHRYDRELLGRIDRTRAVFNEKKQAFETERAKLAALLLAKKKEQLMLLKEEASRLAILSDLRLKKKSNQEMIAELQESQRELNSIIRILEQKRARSISAESARQQGEKTVFQQQKSGSLPWPVKGDVVAGFGTIIHPLYKTTIKNNGIDIKAAAGETVRSVAPGTVIYIGSMRGLGKLVIVDHGAELLTVYANLGEFSAQTDQVVAAGTALGTVASGGDAGGSQLHFEIRKATEPLDPGLWLEKRK